MGAAKGLCGGGQQQAERGKVEPQHHAVGDQNAGGDERRQAAEVEHGLVDPVAIAGKPQETHEIGGQSSAQQGLGMAQISLRQQPIEQGDKRYPGKEGAPERHGADDREWQHKQRGGNDAEQPGLPCQFCHRGESTIPLYDIEPCLCIVCGCREESGYNQSLCWWLSFSCGCLRSCSSPASPDRRWWW